MNTTFSRPAFAGPQRNSQSSSPGSSAVSLHGILVLLGLAVLLGAGRDAVAANGTVTFANNNACVLLNSQTGEVQTADVRIIGEETIDVRGVPTLTTHRRIITDKFTIDLWHTLSGKWVALQSTTAKGNVLRYALR